MKTMEERFAAAVAALDNVVIDDDWHGNDDTAYCVIRAAFPELFDGTAWVAPWEITPRMRAASQGWNGIANIWPAIRDAHLKPSTTGKGE